MASPNIVNVTSIYANTAYIIPSTTANTAAWTTNGSNAITGLTPASGAVNKVGSIVVSNVTGSAALCSVAIANNATFATGTPYYVAYQISVPPNASVVVTDKTSAFYVTENQSVGVPSGTSSALHYIASLETIS